MERIGETMKDKQRRILEGQVTAACIILREVMMELTPKEDDWEKTYKAAFNACMATRELLRALGEMEVEEDKYCQVCNAPPEDYCGCQ